jgi:hypothetical protein
VLAGFAGQHPRPPDADLGVAANHGTRRSHMTDISQHWKDFEKRGESRVRQELASDSYGEIGKKMAREWLEHKAQARASKDAARLAATQSEQVTAAARAAEASIRAAAAAERAATAAERAAEATDRQATAAERATRTAIAALIIAIISGIWTLFTFFHKP